MNCQEMNASLIEMLSTLDLEGVAVTAAINGTGELSKIGGLWEKLGEQTIDLARRGMLHTVVVAAEQDDVHKSYLREDAEPLRVIKVSTVADAIRKLNEASLPRQAVLQKVREECAKLVLLGWKQVSMETLYQELPLLLQVKREKLPRFEREMDEHAESDEEEEVGWRTTELLRWEEEMLKKQVTYERRELTELFDNFQRVVKEATSRMPRFVVLGPPGSGKTTLAQYIAWQVASGTLNVNERKFIPVQVRLRDWERWAMKASHPEVSLPEYLTELHKDLKEAPTVELWRRWLLRGEVMLLLDGLDEITGDEQSFFLTALKNALGFSKCPTVLFCRTVSFEQHRTLFPGPVFTLAGLEDTQRDAYIRAFPAEYPERFDKDALINQLNRMPQMRPLASNPLLLSIICYIVDDPGGVQLPTTRTKLYDKAVDKLLNRPKRVAVRYPDEEPDADEKRMILERVALTLFAHAEERALTFTGRQLNAALKEALTAAGYGDAPARYANALRTDLIKNSGILRGDAEQGYFFLHLTFHEFLTACALAQEADEHGWEAIADLVDRKAWLPTWHEVIVFLTGKLPDEHRERLLALLTNETKDDQFRHRLALAAHCLTECGVPQQRIENESPILAIADYVTAGLFKLWWDCHNRGFDFPHLNRAMPALAQVNGRVNNTTLLSYIIHLLQDEDVRSAAVKLIGEMGSAAGTEKFLAQLAQLHQHEDRWVCQAALKAVGRLGAAAATDAMLSHLGHLLEHKDYIVRNSATDVIGELCAAASTDVTLSHLARMLEHKDYTVRMVAVKTVGELGPSAATDKFLSKLTQLLQHENRDVREHAAEAVGRLGAAAATDKFLSKLTRLLQHEDSIVRAAAADAIGELGPAAATEEILSLLPLLLEEDSYVRGAAGRAVRRLGPTAFTEEILSILEQFPPSHAIEVLGGFPPRKSDWRAEAEEMVSFWWGIPAVTDEYLSLLACLLKGKEQSVFFDFVEIGLAFDDYGLSSFATTDDFLSLLAFSLEQGSDEAREAAVEVVGMLGAKAATEEFLDHLAQLLQHEDSCWAAGAAIGAIGAAAGTAEIISLLSHLLRNDDDKRRRVAVQVLGNLGPTVVTDEILSLLPCLLTDKDRYGRQLTAEAIGKLGVKAATDEILALLPKLLEDEDGDVRNAAVEAMSRLGVRLFNRGNTPAAKLITELAAYP